METYSIQIFPTAEQDLKDTIVYLNTLSSDTALRYYDEIVEGISSLAQMPARCPRPKDLTLRAKGYRYLIVRNYLVFFVISGKTVQIRRILYARRNYRSLL